jgi:hypothetical protein
MAIKQTLKMSQMETKGVESDIVRQEEDNQLLAEQLERLQSEYNRIEDMKFDVAARLDDKFLQKQMVCFCVCDLCVCMYGCREIVLSV